MSLETLNDNAWCKKSQESIKNTTGLKQNTKICKINETG